MSAQGLSEEQRDQVIGTMITMLGNERKFPTKKELEEDILDYLGKKHPCILATCNSDGNPSSFSSGLYERGTYHLHHERRRSKI